MFDLLSLSRYVASGAGALCALLFFVAVVVDGGAVSTAASSEVCTFGTFATDPSKKYVCSAGR